MGKYVQENTNKRSHRDQHARIILHVRTAVNVFRLTTVEFNHTLQKFSRCHSKRKRTLSCEFEGRINNLKNLWFQRNATTLVLDTKIVLYKIMMILKEIKIHFHL